MEGFTSLDIYIHHARNIHNICIYADQDVYAKLSLTSNPDDAVSTRIIHAGGQNPVFNQRLHLQHKHAAAAAPILKCEIWMSSRARNFLEDQLLGFALVPLSAVAGSLTHDFSLSSTDLFHSPAGTVKLTLSFDDKPYAEQSVAAPNSSSISSEFVILDPAKIEFPEIRVDRENQEMVSEYFSVEQAVPFLHLGACLESMDQDSTITTVSDDRQGLNLVSCSGSNTPTSKSNKGEDEESAMQKQIVEMYMRSMQQFTESLAKMKLPMDLNNPKLEGDGDLIQGEKGNEKLETNKKDGSRVFYGSRAFF